MLEHLMNNPVEGIKYIVMIILAVIIFIWYRSIPTDKGSIFRNPKAEKSLKKDFETITETHFDPERDDYMLVVGMCLNIQTSLEKEAQPDEAFKLLPVEKQHTMTLGYIFEDSRKKLSDFFHYNNEPLLSAAERAAKEVIGGEFADIILKEYDMFDEKKEEFSLSEDEVNNLNTRFSELMKEHGKEIYKKAADYIRQNKSVFMS